MVRLILCMYDVEISMKIFLLKLPGETYFHWQLFHCFAEIVKQAADTGPFAALFSQFVSL